MLATELGVADFQGEQTRRLEMAVAELDSMILPTVVQIGYCLDLYTRDMAMKNLG